MLYPCPAHRKEGHRGGCPACHKANHDPRYAALWRTRVVRSPAKPRLSIGDLATKRH